MKHFGYQRGLDHSSDRVAAVNAQVCSGDIAARIAEEVGDSAHEIFWLAHLTLGDQGGPVLVEVWVIIEDLLGSMR